MCLQLRPDFQAKLASGRVLSGSANDRRRSGPPLPASWHVPFALPTELAEFGGAVLDGLREPLEEGVVRVTRARATVDYPARFLLELFSRALPPRRLELRRRRLHRVDAELNVLGQIHAEVRGATHNVIAVDPGGETF